VGDYSASLAFLRPGTRVVVEGPYGTFTRDAQRRQRVLLIAAGIGVTALRALLEDLPARARPIVLLRASRPEDLVLGREVRDLVKHRHGRLHEFVGPREEVSITGEALLGLVPELYGRDVYICGPEGFVAGTVELLRDLRVPEEAIHHEAFAL
jgi:ferredoxin-NADP reductase